MKTRRLEHMHRAGCARMEACLCAVLLPALAGCVSTAHLTKASGYEALAPTDSKLVQVHPLGAPEAGSWEVIGKVYAYKRSGTILSKPSEQAMFARLGELAGSMGAEVVLGAYSSTFNGKDRNSIHRWASGLAARSTADPGRANGPRDFVVAIMPVTLDNSKEGRKREMWLRDAAQYWLEERGYYTVLPDEALAVTPSDLAELDPDKWQALGGPWVNLIFTMELLSASGTNAGIAAGDVAKVRSTLFSKATHSVVWQETTTGDKFSFGLIQVLGGGRTEQAIYEAVKNALVTLEPIRQAERAGK